MQTDRQPRAEHRPGTPQAHGMDFAGHQRRIRAQVQLTEEAVTAHHARKLFSPLSLKAAGSPDCAMCAGTGDGQYGDTRCMVCGGKGYVGLSS